MRKMLPAQTALWQQVETIKRRVQNELGPKPPREFRSTFAYQNYTAMCGEAFWAHKTGELDENLLRLLNEAAEKVSAAWKTHQG
jgi:hypothetical protein